MAFSLIDWFSILKHRKHWQIRMITFSLIYRF